MKIYTKTGDKGETSLFGGTRVPKHDIRIEAYGTVDELNSYIGFIRDHIKDIQIETVLIEIQTNLFTAGAMLATAPDKKILKNGKNRLNIPTINPTSITILEQQMDLMNDKLPEMTHFILPGGHPTVSICHIARCICRRAERRCTELHYNSPVNESILVYLNRLSDYLFVLARKLTKDLQGSEIQWIPEKLK